jgi:hypothetical protein
VSEPAIEASRVPLRGAVRASGSIEYGVLPGFGAGLSLAAALVFPRWRFEATGAFWPARKARLVGYPDVGGDLSLGTATLRGCPTPRWNRVELPLCVGAELGAMRGDGVGADQAVTQTRLWVAAQLAVAFAWRFTDRLALWTEVQAVLALARPEFVIVGAGRLHQAAAVAPRAAFGLEVRFP